MSVPELKRLKACVDKLPQPWTLHLPAKLTAAQFPKYAGTHNTNIEIGCQMFDASGVKIPSEQFSDDQRDAVLHCGILSDALLFAVKDRIGLVLDNKARKHPPTNVTYYEPPTPQLGCRIFDSRSRALIDDELTDKQRYQVANCQGTVEAYRDAAEHPG